MDFFSETDKLDGHEDTPILKAPFAWPGGKSRSVDKILPYLPYEGSYIEVFGGSGIVLLNRKPSKIEVFNDRNSGVIDFYRVLRNPQQYQELCRLVELSLHSKEEFLHCKATYEREENSVVRAYKWYYSVMCSFGRLGRNWGRAVKPPSSFSTQYKDKLEIFPDIHRRLRGVQIDNADFRSMFKSYDNPTAVFYCDPPYVDANRGTYKHEMTSGDFADLAGCIKHAKGFVALSSYENPFWDDLNCWDNKIKWEVHVSIQGGGNKEHLDNKRSKAEEVLYIKEAP
jgi:DNA adenine methylase